MDEPEHPTFQSENRGLRTGKSETPGPDDSQCGSTVTYCGDAARVTEGFAIALALLGLSAGAADEVARNQTEDGE